MPMSTADHAPALMSRAGLEAGPLRSRAWLDACYRAERSRPAGLRWLHAWRWPGLTDGPPDLPAASGGWLQQLVHATRAQLVVTLGTADGAAAVWLAEALRAVPGSRSDRALIGFERDPAAARQARDVLRRAGVSRYVDIRCDAPARVLATIDVLIDLVVLLGGFDDDASELVERLLPRLRAGGSLVVPRFQRRPLLAAAINRHCADDGQLQALQMPLDGGLLWLVKR